MVWRRLAIFQRFITIEVEFAYHNGDEALLKASGRAICYVDGQLKRVRSSPQLPRRRRSIRSRSHVLRGVALGCPRTRRARGQDSVGILLPYLLRTANGRILRLIF